MESLVKLTPEVIREATTKPKSWYSLTGFEALDRLITRLPAYLLLAARPGIGKTTAALQISTHLVINSSGLKLLYAASELGAYGVIERAAQVIVASSLLEAYDQATSEWFVLSGNQFTEIKKAIDKVQPDVLVIDHIQGVSSEQAVERHFHVSRLSNFLVEMRDSCGTTVIATSQLRRSVTGGGTETLADLAWSADLEAGADIVVVISRAGTEGLWRVLKNRWDRCCEIPMRWDETAGLWQSI
jgi:predicted ATP-dependent serine protease